MPFLSIGIHTAQKGVGRRFAMEYQTEPDLHSPRLSPRCSGSCVPTDGSPNVPPIARGELISNITSLHIRHRMIVSYELSDSFHLASVILEAMKLTPGHTIRDVINGLEEYVTTAEHQL